MYHRLLINFFFILITQFSYAQSYDLIIKNGRVIDGTGNPWVYADVAIQNGRIVQIGILSATEAKRTTDATGLIIAPMSISQINQKLGRKNTVDTEADLIMDLMERASLKRIQMVYHTMSETDVETILRYPNTMIASDAGVATFGSGMPHPRAYGTNARVLGRYVRERHVIPLEEAIRRMTSLPAQRFRITDRGLIRPGYAADLAIFDEKTIADCATYEQPHAYTTGISWVIVNGICVIENSQHTGQRPGQVLIGPGYVTR